MTSVKRSAIRDAREAALAKMLYGEGAGNRRKLIDQSVRFKKANSPGYAAAFDAEYARQDFAKLAKKAKRYRRTADTAEAINKNGKALVRGDFRSLSLPILAVAGSVYVVHLTGYDKIALDYGKETYKGAKERFQKRRADRKAKKAESKVHNITTVSSPASKAD